MEKEIMIYETGGKQVQFNLNPGEETIWATRMQMAELFNVTPQNITMHLKAIYNEGELDRVTTSKESLLVADEGGREVRRKVKTYNLDAIISVGYRVNSRKATDLRIWATKVLKKYIVGGVAVNERRLKELSQTELKEVAGTLAVVKRLMAQNELTGAEANGVLEVISQYALTFRTLREYDDGFVKIPVAPKATRVLEAGECMTMIDELREKIHGGEMFGKPRGDAFEGALRAIYQSFDGEDVYATVAEKAANLLYFIIKDHPFFDGNKRIAVFLFMMFLALNAYGLTSTGEQKISDRALIAIALMIAESDPREKGLMTAVVCKVLE
jgi:prophage maintenance system killer protein